MIPHTLGYLRNLRTDERIDFQFNPSDLPVSIGVNYTKNKPRGGSHGRMHFNSTDGRSESITLQFIRRTSDGDDMRELRSHIEALMFSDYDTNGRLKDGPPFVRLQFGGDRSLRVRFTSVKIEQGPWFHPQTTAPGGLTVTLAWEEQPENDLSAEDVRGGR